MVENMQRAVGTIPNTHSQSTPPPSLTLRINPRIRQQKAPNRPTKLVKGMTPRQALATLCRSDKTHTSDIIALQSHINRAPFGQSVEEVQLLVVRDVAVEMVGEGLEGLRNAVLGVETDAGAPA